MGSATNGTWYVGGQVVSTSDGFYSHIYDSAGVYQVDYIGTSWTGSDTASFVFEIIPIPDDSISFSVFDNIICHSESIEIIIDSSESNVFYTLYNSNGDDFGDSPIGNGGLLNYTTTNLSDSGWYYLVATNSLNHNCFSEILDTIHIEAEWTTANFHASHVNCEPNETVQFYQRCRDADNYAWTFEPNATTITSNLATPQNSYTSPSSPSQIELICWSNNGCYDTIYKNGPNIELLPNTIDTCWVSANRSPITAPYNQDPEIHRMIPVQDGYVISGRFYEETFASRFGDSVTYQGNGSYLIKYDFRGMLKWTIYCDHTISNIAEDQNGNIFITGIGQNFIIDNRNDTILTPYSTNFDPEGFIMKLDPLGKMLWYRKSQHIRPYQVSIDENDQVIIGGYANDLLPGIVPLDFNGVPLDTITVNISSTIVDHLVLKFDTNGTLLWSVPMTIDGWNIAEMRDIETDLDNNIYITGAYEDEVITYGTNQSTGDTIAGYPGIYGGHLFLTKLNTAGELLWQTKSISINNQGNPNGGTAPFDMVIDDLGNCYIAGKNDVSWYTESFEFHNTNGSIQSALGGKSFIMKVDSSGVCSWIKCGQYSYYGALSRLHLEDDSLYAIGWIDESNSFVGTPDATFLNEEDSTAIMLAMDRPNYYIATFDTTGYLHSLFMNGDGSNYPSISGKVTDFAGFFKHSDGSFYTTRNMYIYPGTNYDEFGHTMDTDDFDSWVVKAKSGNGINVEPVYLININDNVCSGDSYTLPNGSTINPTYNLIDTTMLSSVNGVDSIIITSLTIITSSTTNEFVSVCSGSSYTFPDGSSSVITGTMTHTSYLVSVDGCDSIVGTTVTPFPGPQSDEYLTVCPGTTVTFPDGQSDSITTAMNYISVLSGSGGCDSTVTTHVSLYPSQYINQSDTVCVGSSYLFADGSSSIISGSTFHESVFVNSDGCDSIIATQVEVYPDINASISAMGGILSAQPGGSAYQWYSCDPNLTPIPNETNSTFSPTINGQYAVEIFTGSCSDTSTCFNYNSANIIESEQLTYMIVPNPSREFIRVESSLNTPMDIQIFDLQGKLIESFKNVSSADNLKIEHLAKGSYLVKIKDSVTLSLMKL